MPPLTARIYYKAVQQLRRVGCHLGGPYPWKPAWGYVLAHPKTGNTWVQVMLRKALVLNYNLNEQRWLSDILQHQIPYHVPVIRTSHNLEWGHSGQTVNDYAGMHFGAFAGKRVLNIQRCAKDTLVSQYFHEVNRQDTYPAEKTVNDYVRDSAHGLPRYITYHKALARDAHLFGAYLPTTYEALKADTLGELKRICSFFKLNNLTDADYQTIVTFGSFKNMRAMEQSNALGKTWLAAGNLSNDEAANTSANLKTRQGKVGAWQEHINPETAAWIDAQLADAFPATNVQHL